MNKLLQSQLQKHLGKEVNHLDEKISSLLTDISDSYDLNEKNRTASKNVEIDLRESREQIQTIFDAALDAVIIINEDGMITKWDTKAESLFGWKEKEVLGISLSETIIPHHLREAHQRGMKHFLKTGHGPILGRTIEVRALNKSEIEFDISLSICPTVIKNKYQFIGFIRDITERKKAEIAIRESENKYRGLFEKMADGVYKSSHEGKFIDVNPALVTMLGYASKEELLAIDIKTQLYFDTADREEAVLQDQMDGISVFRLKKKNSKEIWVEDRGQYISDEQGNVLYHEGILRDVTKRLQAEQQLRKSEMERKAQQDALQTSNEDLIKSNLELDKFVYSVSHDLRAPLSSMLGIVEISLEETTEPLMLEHLALLKESIKRLDGFITDILDYSRNSRTELRKEEINFKEILNDITSHLKYMRRNNHPVEIIIDIRDEKKFLSDKSRISTVLNNLISNAIRYQNPAINDPFVNIKIDMSDTQTNIVVKDNGIGISKENIEKIFDMFYRVSENSIGSGLGLYIVKETVNKLNGIIKVESKPGAGTTFQLSIPNLILQ